MKNDDKDAIKLMEAYFDMEHRIDEEDKEILREMADQLSKTLIQMITRYQDRQYPESSLRRLRTISSLVSDITTELAR